MKSPGELTAQIARKLSQDWNGSEYRVIYDHEPSSENVGKIVSWFGEDYKRGTRLSLLDIAILDIKIDIAIALFEIEETNDKPKTLLGDALCVLMGDHISFIGKYEISLDERTSLFIFGKSGTSNEKHNEERNTYLRKKVMEIKSSLSTGNSVIGNVIIESFSNKEGLVKLLPTELDRAFLEEERS